ncbi:MAG: nucleotidyl transferase AbiEii/AbiGii toxin family protein [Caldilineaceae bacterium]|nr:nucleotidyl transferase AbiEii/AbiGii toxin family protein [Caldilineaceae bacterium]MBP8108579.1 nucleotidyl transferase AbiEii/AbiGii toxin family protein [Caldilineaceae bacterium]MBP8124393.1 nucleotidyl transferase AbiEii/AbiGii toxin family protein [Caldilineaceae bacterium]MBP9071317.1 nucleotidyl transferase AbiEii/AbiGii toxin family protein [Caldilineaceae bacterium]
MDNSFYEQFLYPLQDQVLRTITELETGFYLTGGTAASRGYLQHRYSDDLDFFVNDDARFSAWTDQILNALAGEASWKVAVRLRGERFVGLTVLRDQTELRIDLVNDVRARVGTPYLHPLLGLMDTAENILANKVTAVIDREQPKDLADIWGFCTKLHLSLADAIEGADSKAAGIFHADLARVLCSTTEEDWTLIRWIEAPDLAQFVADMRALGEGLIL